MDILGRGVWFHLSLEAGMRFAHRIEKNFAPLALAATVLAWYFPRPFGQAASHIPALLGVIMFSMGATLSLGDFRGAVVRRGVLLYAAVLQFGIMPLAAFAIARGLGLPPELAAGLVLVGACPGGTASNVICYLAGADLALSVAMTLVSTLLAPLLTPPLVWVFARQWVPVPVGGLFRSILLIVIVPLAAGLLLRQARPGFVRRISPWLPALSVACIVTIIAAVVAVNRGGLGGINVVVIAAVALHNLVGFYLGYRGARLAGLDCRTARTISVEVGMQNSGLGVSLALVYFGPLAAAPGAVFSLWQNLAGAGLANWWRAHPAGGVAERSGTQE